MWPQRIRDATRAHRVSIVSNYVRPDGAEQTAEVPDPIEYRFSSSMVEPSDSFSMTFPFSQRAWDVLRPDSPVRIQIDGVTQLVGLIDGRKKMGKNAIIEVVGRDKVGRLCQESVPTTSGFAGLDIVETVKRVADPWFVEVALSDARNRAVRLGRGHRAAVGAEPAILLSKSRGRGEFKHQVIDPGELCWQVIMTLASSIGLIAWSSADGREIIIAKPNYDQGVQYLFQQSRTRGSTVKDLIYAESLADRVSLLEIHGAAKGNDTSYAGDVSYHNGQIRNGPNADGTGADFRFRKRVSMPQNAVQSNAEAKLVAEREMARRDFQAKTITAICSGHGQVYGPGQPPTLFATNTIARVVDFDFDKPLDILALPYACEFTCQRRTGPETTLQMVPKGTAFVQ